MFLRGLIGLCGFLWAAEAPTSYQALIERQGQAYEAYVQFDEKEQHWSFAHEPYTLTVGEHSVILHDRLDDSTQEMSWEAVHQDFHWLVLFPCLQKSLEALHDDFNIAEQRFDFEDGCWVLHRRGLGWVGRWLPRQEGEEDLLLFLQENLIN